MTAPARGEAVVRPVTALFIDPNGFRGEIPIKLSYDPRRPFEVRMSFTDDDGEFDWAFARELLVDGAGRAAGMADVQVWPTGALVRVRLATGHESVEVSIPLRELRGFLAAVEQLAPAGTERVDVDGWLAEWCAGCGGDVFAHHAAVVWHEWQPAGVS